MAKKKARTTKETPKLAESEEAIDKRQWLEAQLKLARGETPTRGEAAASRRHIDRERKELLSKTLKEMPQREFLKLLGHGVSRKAVLDLCHALGLPGFEESVDATQWLPAVYRKLADNWSVLTDDEEAKAERKMRAAKLELEAEKYRYQVAEFREKTEELARNRVDIGDVRDILCGLADKLRKFGEQLGRRKTVPGQDAQRQLNAVLDGFEKEVESL